MTTIQAMESCATENYVSWSGKIETGIGELKKSIFNTVVTTYDKSVSSFSAPNHTDEVQDNVKGILFYRKNDEILLKEIDDLINKVYTKNTLEKVQKSIRKLDKKKTQSNNKLNFRSTWSVVCTWVENKKYRDDTK